MIYVTGDMHGDISRLRSKAARRLRKNDYLIVCGDFGFIWDGSEKERRLLKWLGKRPYHVLFVEGTHDNLDLLNSYPLVEWNGGMTHELSGKVRHLVRGHVFTLDEAKVFAFGGGESADADVRVQDGMWWHDELPTPEIVEQARQNLQKHGNRVDYIITHQASHKIKRFLSMSNNEFNILDVFFDELRDNCKYTRWFFGNYHINKRIPPSNVALFSAIVPAAPDKF